MRMLVIDRIINLLTLLGSFSAAKKTFPRTLLRDIMIIACLLLMAVILVSAFIVFGLIALHSAILNQGLEESEAIAIVTAGTAIIVMTLVGTAQYKIKTLVQSQSSALMRGSRPALPEQITGIADAFMDGLLRRPYQPDKN